MEIHQILIRPTEHTVIMLYTDGLGHRFTKVFDSTGDATVAALISQYEQQLPPDDANPAKTEIQQEIAALEDRLTKLKESIGVT